MTFRSVMVVAATPLDLYRARAASFGVISHSGSNCGLGSSQQSSLQGVRCAVEGYSVAYGGGRVSSLGVFLQLVLKLLQDTLAGCRVGLE